MFIIIIYEIGAIITFIIFLQLCKLKNIGDFMGITTCAIIWPISWIGIAVIGIELRIRLNKERR